jgi:signal transduction histidine kinase
VIITVPPFGAACLRSAELSRTSEQGTTSRDRTHENDPGREGSLNRTTRAAGDVASSGSGLGLAIARAIVEDHGGRIGAARHPEGGTVVTIHLPTAHAPR